MKPIQIFSPQHNSANQKTEKSKKLPTGYVSATGKLVFSTATLEELGIEAETWIDLGVVHPMTSMLYAPAQLFLAKKLSFFQPDPEASEIIRLVKVKLSEAVRMVIESEITHAPSCVLILKASHVLQV